MILFQYNITVNTTSKWDFILQRKENNQWPPVIVKCRSHTASLYLSTSQLLLALRYDSGAVKGNVNR